MGSVHGGPAHSVGPTTPSTGGTPAWPGSKCGDRWRVRFRNPDGSVATDSSRPTKTAATARADAIETDQQRDVFMNPEHVEITLATWVEEWLDAHDVA